MLRAQPLIGVARRESILPRYDNRHLRPRGQERRRYRERPSTGTPLSIEVPVVTLGEIVDPASKQPDNLMGRMAGDIYTDRFRGRLSRQFRDSRRTSLRLDDSQFNFLSVFKADFAEGLKNSVFVKRVEGF
jgi:hypothetical protein